MDPQDAPDPQLGTTGLLNYAKDLEQEIRQLGVKPIVMGHSMGGTLAQILGSRGLTQALVLLTPAATARIMALRPSVIKSFWSMQKKWCFWKKPMRQSKVTCPTLVISGAKDRITPASVVRQVAKKYKAVSTYKEFKNNAHWVVSEPGWQEIAAYAADWLEQILAEEKAHD